MNNVSEAGEGFTRKERFVKVGPSPGSPALLRVDGFATLSHQGRGE